MVGVHSSDLQTSPCFWLKAGFNLYRSWKNCLSRSRVRKGHWTWFLGFFIAFTLTIMVFVLTSESTFYGGSTAAKSEFSLLAAHPYKVGHAHNINFGLFWVISLKQSISPTLPPPSAGGDGISARQYKSWKLQFQQQDIISFLGWASALLQTGHPQRGRAHAEAGIL